MTWIVDLQSPSRPKAIGGNIKHKPWVEFAERENEQAGHGQGH